MAMWIITACHYYHEAWLSFSCMLLHFSHALFMQSLSCGFPDTNNKLTQFRENLSRFQGLRWDHYWKLHVLPLVKDDN